MSTTSSCADCSAEEKRRVLDRVLKSHTFSRSDQLKRFLQYICEKEIEGKADQINEYSIAIDALGRPAGYSPADDSSVRTRAHALRQKLQEYYQLEEPDAELRIEVPKGAYSPHFNPHLPPSAGPPQLSRQLENPLPVPARQTPWKPFLTGALAAALTGALALSIVVLLRGSYPKRSPLDPAIREAWRQMLNPGEKVDIYIATPPAMLLHSYKVGQLPRNGHTLLRAPDQISSWYGNLQMLDGGGDLYMHSTQDVFLFGDSLAATSVAELLSRSGAVPQLIPESNLRAFALRGKNVVLIGSPNYSPLAARFLMNMPFSVRYDAVRREEVVSEGNNKDGSKRTFWPARNELGMLTKAYGLVTVFPSEGQAEGRAQTMIFSGITSAGPQAGVEFFRSSNALRILKNKLREQGYSHVPAAYQVIVRCSLDHNLALNWEYETHQLIKGTPLLN